MTTFINRPANSLWFGIRKDFSDFVLDSCPFLREYANISVHERVEDEEELVDAGEANGEPKKSKLTKSDELALIEEDVIDPSEYPYEDLMLPD